MINLKSLLEEAVETIGPDDLTPELYDQLQKMISFSESGISILSDKEVDTIYLIDGKVAGALFTSYIADKFSFDTIVAKEFRNQMLGARIIRQGLEQFRELSIDNPEARLELDVVNDKLVKPLQNIGLSIIQQVGGHTIMGYVNDDEDPDIKAVAEMNIPADDNYQPTEGESIERVVWNIKKGDDIKTHDLGVVGLEGAHRGVYGIHVTSDPEYWMRRAGLDFDRNPRKGKVVHIYCKKGDMYVEDPQYVTDPDTGIKSSSFILLTKRRVLKYGQDWGFK